MWGAAPRTRRLLVLAVAVALLAASGGRMPSDAAGATSAPAAVPTITGVSPMSGPVGSTVTITGTNFVDVNLVSFYDYPTSFTVDSPTQITAQVPAGTPSPGRWRVRTPDGIAVHDPLFTVTSSASTITGVSPMSGPVGSSVTITGTSFVNVNLVSFYDYPTTYTVDSPTQITATVPAGTPSPGRWRVRTPAGLAVYQPLFTVGSSPPTITNVSPMSGPVGSTVTITGTSFVNVNLVSFYDYPTTYTLVSPTQITAQVPSGTPSPGRWRVRTPTGLAVYNPLFTVTQSPPPPPPGLVAAYAFDAGSGTSAVDESGNANTGTLSNATWASGHTGTAVGFNGSNSLVVVNDAPSLDLSSGMTLEAWVRPAALAGWQTVMLKEAPGIGSGLAYGLYANTTNVPTGIMFTTSEIRALGTGQLPVNTWTHLAVTYDGSALRLYVDGTLVRTQTALGSMSVSGSPLRMGGNAIWGEYFNGLLDDVRVYNRALSASEIQTDMSSPVAPSPPDTSPPSTPSGLTASGISQSSVTLSWGASSDNVGVVGYGAYRNGSSVGSTPSTSYTFSGLACGTSYTFAVDAFDAAGNRSPQTSLTVSTASCSGTSGLCDPPTSGSAWYVKNGGSGSNNGMSWANAWTAFGSINWASIAPGDTVFIDGGTTSVIYTSTWSVQASGTSGNPIKICPGQDAGHNGTVIFDYSALSPNAAALAIQLGGNDHITISGEYDGARHMELNNLFNTSSGTTSVGVAGVSGNNVGITVDHIRFFNDNNPVRLTYANSHTISYNSFEGVRGDAALGMAGSTPNSANKIHHNYIEMACTGSPTCAGPDGIQIGGGSEIYDNDFKQIRVTQTTSGQHPDMIQAQSDNHKIYNNTFTNIADSAIDYDAFSDTSPADILVYNNVFRIVTEIDPYPQFFRLYTSGAAVASITNVKVMNNVFADSDEAYPLIQIFAYNGNPTATGNELKNNLWVNSGNGSSGGPVVSIDNSTGFTGSSWAFDYNNFYLSNGEPYIHFRGTNYTASLWVAANEPNGSTSLPAFVSYSFRSASNDFHLASSDTVAANTGASLSAYFSADKDGINRPQSSAWDRGPYERVGDGSGGGGLVARIWVSTAGSAACTRSPTAVAYADATGHICDTWNRADAIAENGDTIRVKNGTYGACKLYSATCVNNGTGTLINAGHSHTGYVTFACGDENSNEGVAFNNADTMIYGSHIIIDGGGNWRTGVPSCFRFRMLNLAYSGSSVVPDHITIQNSHLASFMDMGGQTITFINNEMGPLVACTEQSGVSPCRDIAIDDEKFWHDRNLRTDPNESNYSAAGACTIQPSNLTIDANLIHDMNTRNSGLFHTGGFQNGSSASCTVRMNGLTIRNNVFRNNAVYHILPATSDSNVLIENNWFGTLRVAADGGCTPMVDCAIQSGQYAVAPDTRYGNPSDWLIRFNTFKHQLKLDADVTYTNFRVIGNVFDLINPNCATSNGALWTYNLFATGPACSGTGNITISGFPVVRRDSNADGSLPEDYHLSGAPGSTAADNHVSPTASDYALATDHDGEARSAPRDAGADGR